MHLRTLWITALLVLLAIVSSNAADQGLPEQVIPNCFGVNIHFTGDRDKEVKQIADGGFRFVRMDILWNECEKEKGMYDFSAYDGLMTALDRHGIRALFIVCYGNPIYSGNPDVRFAPVNDESRKAFAAYAGALAKHYRGRGILWEIWNEPNYGFWQPGPDPVTYALAANMAAKAIHAADPTATVMGPATAYMDPPWLEAAFKLGVLENFDVVSVHPYRGGNMSPETAIPEFKPVFDVVSKYTPKGKTIPVISSEWGYTQSDFSAEKQAEFMIRAFLGNMMSGMKLSIWYDWHDDGESPKEREHHFGTVYFDYTPKPAYKAMQTLTKTLTGYRLVRRMDTAKPDDYVLLFTDGATNKLAAWTTGEAHAVSIAIDAPAVILTDMYGKRKRGDVKDGKLSLTVSQSVTYVSIPGKSKLPND